ncbi:MAG: TIGR01212 family radical SAM protein, partial [Candidatus Omnitrophica bacterium]|nr:TIGR01212 family radical SAM protein [Candidatus Omnitrophota bacterium]
SSTNTNAGILELEKAYNVIKKYPEVVALYIATRPDCIDEEKLELIAGFKKDYEVWIEYGVQTIHEKTLKFINRGHTFAQSVNAINRTARKGIKVGAHLMLGLPGETKKDMIATAKEISKLPVSGVKLHVLHVLKGTRLEEMYNEGKIKLLDKTEYVGIVCDFLENLKSDCVILRLVSDAKDEVLIAPKWINDKLSVINAIDREFASRGTKQGSACA